MFDVTYNKRSGIVRSVITGTLTFALIDEIAYVTNKYMDQARNDFGRAYYLIDASHAVVQPREIIAKIEEVGSFLRGPDDRLAILVSAVLNRMQANRLLAMLGQTGGDAETFLDESEACIWLCRPASDRATAKTVH